VIFAAGLSAALAVAATNTTKETATTRRNIVKPSRTNRYRAFPSPRRFTWEMAVVPAAALEYVRPQTGRN